MVSEATTTNEKIEVKRYKIQYPISDYTFPKETHIHIVRFDDTHLHIELTDERILSIPLWWIPTLYNATPAERNKFEINHGRDMILWDPDKCSINEEISIADYI
ncbi:DUF2442 domain-containing protein [candidate division KSB1 bacterium]|nr:DUF2442 domain-containing protein [candidate division KSB1 bacterium]